MGPIGQIWLIGPILEERAASGPLENRSSRRICRWLLNVTAYYASGQKKITITISNCSRDERGLSRHSSFRLCVFQEGK